MENQRKKMLLADASLLVVAFLWGSSFVVTKGSLDYFSPFYLVGLRFMFAFLILAVFLNRKLFQMDRETLKAGVILGIILYIAFAFQTSGLKYLDAGKQAFMTATNVVMVPFIFWMMAKEKPDTYAVIGSILTIIGIGFLTLNTNFKISLGEVLTLICAFFYALHVVVIGHFTQKHKTIELLVVQIGVNGLLSILTAIFFEPTLALTSYNPLINILYMAVFTTIVAFYIQTAAQKNTTPTHTAIIISLESVFATILSIIYMGEVFNPRMIVGCLIIFIAIITTETQWKFLRSDTIKKSIEEKSN